MRGASLFTLVIVWMQCLGVASAQSTLANAERSQYSTAAFYSYSEPGDIVMRVKVWGTVRNPGLYEVPEGTTISTVFSVAGGPVIMERSRRNNRTIIMRLFREVNGRTEEVYNSLMTDEVFAASNDPVMRDGDVLTVETVVSERVSWRDMLSVVAAVASAVVAADALLR